MKVDLQIRNGRNELPKGQMFRRLFWSYVLIIFLCFGAYTIGVMYDAIHVNSNQVDKMYETKVSEMAVVMDKELYSAQSIISNINSSTVLNKFYINIKTGETIDSYLLYQVLNEIKRIKTAAGNLHIYDIVLALNNYDKVYTSGEVMRINSEADIEPLPYAYFGENNLNELFNGNNNQLLFYKDYLIYSDKYRYMSGSVRGNICVLFEKEYLYDKINQIVGNDASWIIRKNGDETVASIKAEGEKIFTATSQVNPYYTYEIIANKKAYQLDVNAFWTVALIIGCILCLIYIALSYYFSRKYYSPIKAIKNIIGEEKKTKDEIYAVVESVEHLLGERNGYKEQVVTITPYAERGIWQDIISGKVDKENLEFLREKELFVLNKLYYMLAIINIKPLEELLTDESILNNVRKRLIAEIKKRSNSQIELIAYEKDRYNLCIIINSDESANMEDFVYELYTQISEAVNKEECILTIGVDEIRDEISELKYSWECAQNALEAVLVEGYGGVKFYEKEQKENCSYHFVKDAEKRIIKAIKDLNKKEIQDIFNEIVNKNMKEYDLSLSAMRMLLDEIYMISVKAINKATLYSKVYIRVEKPNAILTFEEVKEYYENVFFMVMEYISENNITNVEDNKAQDIVEYVNENYTREDLSLTYIAEKFEVNNKYVSSIFKDKFGITYLQYVQKLRIEYSVELLNQTTYSLEEISKRCGYTNLLTFRRNFKTIMNMNPGEYKEIKMVEVY